MLWGSQKKDDTSSKEPQQPVSRTKLPPQMQKLVDHDDGFYYDDVYTPYSVDSTETPYRYAGYANRLRTILLSAHRYVAYTSDIGESFRPVAHPYLVRTAYGISWTYLIGDVAHEGYKAYLRNRLVLAPPGEAYKDSSPASPSTTTTTTTAAAAATSPNTSDTLTPWPTTSIPLIEDYRLVMAKRAVFQSIASMGLPALTIHSVVKYSGRILKNQKNAFLRTWTPIGLGLAVVPFLPFIFDEPVEEAVEWVFRSGLRAYAGEDAIRPLPLPAGAGAGPHVNTPPAAENLTWDEYKEELRQAKELRKQEREERGQAGVLAALGFGGSGSSSGSKEKRE